MSNTQIWRMFSVFMLTGMVPVLALERGAQSIEAVRIEGASYRRCEDMGLTISTDRVVDNTAGAWAVIAEIGGGRLSQKAGPSFDRLQLGLGVKRHLGLMTSFSLLGGYRWYQGDDRFEVGAVSFSGRQFLVPPVYAVAPYIRLNGELQFVDPSLSSPGRQTGSYRMVVLEALAGCEFRMREGLAFIFEAGVSDSETLSGGGTAYADGFLLQFAMQYDWF